MGNPSLAIVIFFLLAIATSFFTSDQYSRHMSQRVCIAAFVVFGNTSFAVFQTFMVLFRYILESPSFELFFKYVELPNFDIASDAFSTFKVRYISFQFCLTLISYLFLFLDLDGVPLFDIVLVKCLQDLLTKHEDAVSEYLTAHYDEVCCFSFVRKRF